MSDAQQNDQAIEKPESLETQYSPELYAQEVQEEYENAPEKPQSAFERIRSVVTEGTSKIFKALTENELVKKVSEDKRYKAAALVLGAIGTAWVGYKALSAIGSKVTDAVEKTTDNGKEAQEKTSGVKKKTIIALLGLALGIGGGYAGYRIVGKLWDELKNKLSLPKLIDAWGSEEGLFAYLARSIKEGAIKVGEDTWNAVKNRKTGEKSDQGTRAAETPQSDETQSGHKETASESQETGFERLEGNFTELKSKILGYFEKLGKPPIDSIIWLKNLNFLEVLKDLGISKLKQASWTDYAKVGGGALLLYTWLKKKGIYGIATNVVLYLFLAHESKDGAMTREIIDSTSREVDEFKKKLMDGMRQMLKDIPGSDLLIPDIFEDFSVEKNVDYLMNWISENPGEAVLGIDAFLLCKGLLWKALKKVAGFAFGHPVLTVFTTATVYLGRRAFIEKFTRLVYPDPNSEAGLKMQKFLDSMAGVNRSKPEGISERIVGKEAPQILKLLVEDPLKALNMETTKEALRKGEFALGCDIAGKFYYMGKFLTAPLQLVKLTEYGWDSFKENCAAFYSPEKEGNGILPIAVSGLEMFVFGSMAYEGFKAYLNVIESGEGSHQAFWKGLKSLRPLSKEWRFVLRSSLEGFPGYQRLLRNLMAYKIGKSQSDLQIIRFELSKPKPNYKKIQDISNLIKERLDLQEFDKIKDALPKNNFYYELYRDFRNLRENTENIWLRAGELDTQSLDLTKKDLLTKQIKTSIETIDERLKHQKSMLSGILKRASLLSSGRFKEAFSLRIEDDTSIEAPPLETLELFEGKSTQELESDRARLRTEIPNLKDGDPLKIQKIKELSAIESYLDQNRVLRFTIDKQRLQSLDETKRVAELEKLAAEIEGMDKGLSQACKQKMDQIAAYAKANNLPLNDPEITRRLEDLDRTLTIPFGQKKADALKFLTEEYNKLPRKLRTRALHSQIRLAREGAQGTFLTRMTKSVKGRAKMMVLMASLMFATEQLTDQDEAEKDLASILEELGPDLRQLFWSVLPISGTYIDFYGAVTGKEYVTGKDVSGTWDRVSNVIWGAVGAAGDVLTVVSALPSGGASLALNSVARLTKLANEGSDAAKLLLRMWPRIEGVVERLGGWYEFLKKAKKYVSDDTSKIARGIRRIEKVGTIGGTTLFVGGMSANLYYGFIDTDIEDLEAPSDL